jgi:hypothetical protein
VFSGMLIATILGVLLVPMLYVLVERLAGFDRKRAAAADKPPALDTTAVSAIPAHGSDAGSEGH